MRTIAAVLALVACVHVGLWASLRTKENAPDFTGPLASVSYAPPTDPNPADEPTAEDIRADLKAIAPLHQGDPHLFVDRRRRDGAGDRGGIRPEGHGRRQDIERPGRTANRSRPPSRATSGKSATPSISPASNSNVNAILVGNETVLTNEITADDLVASSAR